MKKSFAFSSSLFCLSFLIGLSFSCKKPTEPTDTTPGFSISVEDVSCIEAWVRVKSEGLKLPAEIFITKNDTQALTFTMTTADTVVMIDSLLPKQNYTLRAFRSDNTKTVIEAKVTTMDTTSHNFTWQTITFGEHSSSVFYDVVIINENNIWAVGHIYMKDSIGNSDDDAYNAAHWNGNNWEIKRIRYYGKCSAVTYPPLMAIWAYDSSNFVITDGGSIGWSNGNIVRLDCGVNPLLTGAIKKIWGTSSSDLFAVGNSGNIAHYNGSIWTKIESGTTLNINDIWGDYNERTREWEILAACGNIRQGWENERAVIKIANNNLTTQLNAEGVKWPLSGVWLKPGKKYYLVGSGIYSKFMPDNLIWDDRLTSITSFHANTIRGNDINDIIIAGAYGITLHFNGFIWQSFMSETGLSNGTYLSVGIKNNLVVAVGRQSAKAVITIGKRK